MAKAKETTTKRRKRIPRPYPTTEFGDALDFAAAIYRIGSGQPVRRLTLFDELNKSPDSGASRQLIADANKYGLVTGNYSSEQLELTKDGKTAANKDAAPREQARAKVQLAILNVPPFKGLYETFAGNKLPSRAVLADKLREQEVVSELIDEGVDNFILNLQSVNLLQTLAGSERILTLDHLLDGLPATPLKASTETTVSKAEGASAAPADAEFDTMCFYITPIGSDDSDTRKHSDLFLGSIVEPALESLGLNVVRADAIDKPGVITKQIIEYLLKAKLVIADLSFHNPNVFYELAIRHAARLPTVQITRTQDPIPFDLNQSRTVRIDCFDIYSLVPKLDVYKSEIAAQVRKALDDPDAVDNPISIYYPSFRVKL